MKLSRRHFLTGASVATLLTNTPDLCKAWIHGYIAPVTNGQMVINAGSIGLAFLNIVNQLGITSGPTNFPALLSSNGFPSTTLSSNLTGSGFSLDTTYYGHYYCYWVGTGAFQISGPPCIVYSGGTSTSLNSSSGSYAGNPAFGYAGSSTQPTSSTPIEFTLGALISTIANNGSGFARLTSTKSGAFTNIPSSGTIQLNNFTNVASGLYVYSKIDSNNVDLTALSFSAGMAVIGGNPGTASEIIFALTNNSWNFPSAGTYSGFGGMVICKTVDFANIQAGKYVNPNYIAQWAALNPRFLRFMDFSAVQGSCASSWTYRPVPTNQAWGATNFVSAYYTPSSSIALGAGSGNFTDVFTCSNPSASPSSGAYLDGEIISGQLGGTQTGVRPALNVNSRGNAPIYGQQGDLLNVTMTGSLPTSGSVQAFLFTGGGLSSPHTVNYTVQSSDTSQS